MAFAATVVWEVQTGGSDSNGGGFDPTSGTPGTDYSQQTSPQVTYTDLVIDGTTNTKCTSAGNPFTSAHVGNIINITSGTGFTVQRVQIMSVTAGAATCDKSLGTLGSTGGNGKLGGCLLTVGTANGLMVASNDCYIKSGTYTLTSTITIALASVAKATRFIGYQTTRGDNTGTRPLITTATNSTILFTGSGSVSGYEWRNINFSNTAGTRARGFRIGASGSSRSMTWRGCSFDGFTNAVEEDHDSIDYMVGQCALIACEVKNGTTNGLRLHAGALVVGCFIHDNAGSGVYFGTASSTARVSGVHHCIISENAVGITLNPPAAISPGVVSGAHICSNVIASNTGNGIAMPTSSYDHSLTIINNIIAYNGAYGVSYTKVPAQLVEMNNAYISNTSGNLYFGVTGTIDSTSVTLSGDPFTNKASDDYSLNNTAGAGAACRAVGFPGAFPAGLTTGYLDIGAAQHADPAGGGGGGPVMGGMVVR